MARRLQRYIFSYFILFGVSELKFESRSCRSNKPTHYLRIPNIKILFSLSLEFVEDKESNDLEFMHFYCMVFKVFVLGLLKRMAEVILHVLNMNCERRQTSLSLVTTVKGSWLCNSFANYSSYNLQWHHFFLNFSVFIAIC